MTHFSQKCPCLLEVELRDEKVMALAGAMVAYAGTIKFEKSLLGGEGLFGAFKRKIANEGIALMQASGAGRVFFAHQAQEVTTIRLNHEKLCIESSSLLAFDSSLKTNVAFAGLRGAVSGQGLFTTTVEGEGQAAVISKGDLIALEVSPAYPLHVDPDAFIAYKGDIRQEFVFDVNWRTTLGETSGESYQLKFTGQGTVFIQPAER
jgi:uncharacterized protein (AIM24 family)